MDPAPTLLKILAVLVLVGINAGFVAAEFALVAVRRTRIEQLARAGDARARLVAAAIASPDDFISAAQLGITLASIGIGWLAESTLHALLLPVLESLPFAWPAGAPVLSAHGAALVLTLGAVTYLHVVLGEQVPKMISIQRSEPVALLTVGPTVLFARLLKPAIRFMSGSATLVIRAMGLQPTATHTLAHTPEEIALLVEQSHQEGMVEAEEEEMIQGVLEFRERWAREVMTPRLDVVALSADADPAEVLRVASEGLSRIPVYEGTLDSIVGILLVKDLLPLLAAGGQDRIEPRRLMREAFFVPDSKRIGELLTELRARGAHMAIVLDEYGGTDGIVTMEDLLEEIVGEIFDEHDTREPEFTTDAAGAVHIDGGASLEEVNDRYELALPLDDFDTLGGFILGALGRMPDAGDRVVLDGATLVVEEVEERRVTRVRLEREAPPSEPAVAPETEREPPLQPIQPPPDPAAALTIPA